MTSALQPRRDDRASLTHVIETLLDKGIVLNADIMVSVAGVELLGIRIRAALASFETAAKYGLEFPSGTDTSAPGWQRALVTRESCPSCGKLSDARELLEKFCPWCGWQSARARSLPAAPRSGEEDAGPPAMSPTPRKKATARGSRGSRHRG
ncbi:MAG TPA: gas vesicle protein GvpJ [Vicinamibacterales bacterium]|nr:gas vesicle protein GvpJ [Vicinamibacterales bacterium]